MGDWQFIHSAPNMTAVLVHHPYYSAGQVRHAYINRQGYWVSAENDCGLPFDPTHWMPLPAPPVIKQMTGNPATVGV